MPRNQPRFIPSVIQPTVEQLAIQLALVKILLVLANAGAAKTTSLALAIGEALAAGVPPEAILALTFTAEARDVLKDRLRWLGIHRDLVERIHIATFDEFAQGVLDARHDVPGSHASASEALRPYALEALSAVSERYGHQHSDLDISTTNLGIDQFLKSQLSVKARMLLERERDGIGLQEFAETHGITLTHLLWTLEYERIRLGSFGIAKFMGPLDATYDLARLIRAGEISSDECPSYSRIFCDELHDINESAFTVLEFLIQQPGCRFVGAGDNDQVIYGARGADAALMRQRFDLSFPGKVTRLKLTPSRRFGPHLAMSMEKFKGKPVSSLSATGTTISKVTYPKGDWVVGAERAAQAVQAWSSTRAKPCASAILIRSIHHSVAIETALIQSGQSYRCEGFQSFVARHEILYLRAILAIGFGNLDTANSVSLRKSLVEALITFGEISFADAATDTFGGRFSSEEKARERALCDISSDPAALKTFYEVRIAPGSSHAHRQLVGAVEYLKSSAADLPAGDALRELVTTTSLVESIGRHYVSREEADVVGHSVSEFVALAGRSGQSLKQFSEWINNLERTVKRSRSKTPDIIVGLVATSKGKEYDHVVLPFLEHNEFPKAGRALDDEENLFYVGATRAKQQLTLVVPDNPDDMSDFVRRMSLSSIKTKADVATDKMLQAEAGAGIVDLKVPYEAKDQAKALGARWDAIRRTWYAPPGTDLEPLKIWIKSPDRER